MTPIGKTSVKSLEQQNAAFDDARSAYIARRRAAWDALAPKWAFATRANATYHRRLADVYRWLVPSGSRVLEVGCGAGDLLAAVSPAAGVGVDFSSQMLAVARGRHPSLEFVETEASELELSRTFDFIISVRPRERRVGCAVGSGTRALALPRGDAADHQFPQYLWALPRAVAQSIGAAKPLLGQNWLTANDITNLLDLAGFEMWFAAGRKSSVPFRFRAWSRLQIVSS